MSHIVKPLPRLPWPFVALDLIDNPDISLQLLAVSPPGTSPASAIPLELAMQRSRDLLPQVGAWRHGGINE
jgi:hypothetical protein